MMEVIDNIFYYNTKTKEVQVNQKFSQTNNIKTGQGRNKVQKAVALRWTSSTGDHIYLTRIDVNLMMGEDIDQHLLTSFFLETCPIKKQRNDIEKYYTL
jgi:hypothetical protein